MSTDNASLKINSPLRKRKNQQQRAIDWLWHIFIYFLKLKLNSRLFLSTFCTLQPVFDPEWSHWKLVVFCSIPRIEQFGNKSHILSGRVGCSQQCSQHVTNRKEIAAHWGINSKPQKPVLVNQLLFIKPWDGSVFSYTSYIFFNNKNFTLNLLCMGLKEHKGRKITFWLLFWSYSLSSAVI